MPDHVLVQSRKWKHQNNMWNMFKVDQKRNQNDVVDVVVVSL